MCVLKMLERFIQNLMMDFESTSPSLRWLASAALVLLLLCCLLSWSVQGPGCAACCCFLRLALYFPPKTAGGNSNIYIYIYNDKVYCKVLIRTHHFMNPHQTSGLGVQVLYQVCELAAGRHAANGSLFARV